eukprot:6208060-Pleurochrysis_carterae.AAC.2
MFARYIPTCQFNQIKQNAICFGPCALTSLFLIFISNKLFTSSVPLIYKWGGVTVGCFCGKSAQISFHIRIKALGVQQRRQPSCDITVQRLGDDVLEKALSLQSHAGGQNESLADADCLTRQLSNLASTSCAVMSRFLVARPSVRC